jgi:hypothetical protein
LFEVNPSIDIDAVCGWLGLVGVSAQAGDWAEAVAKDELRPLLRSLSQRVRAA